jgi:hypothetical protein
VSKKFYRVSFKVDRVDIIDERTWTYRPAMSGELEVDIAVRADTPEEAIRCVGVKLEDLIASEIDCDIARRSDR